MLLRARVVLPVSAPPIQNGAVLVSGKKIRAVGSWRDLQASAGGPSLDLGDVILLPGLVNAHCHLDYTHVAGSIPPRKFFTDWVQTLLALKAGWRYSEYADSWVDGAQMLLKNGTTTVADIETIPDLLPDVWQTTPLRVHSFLELTSVKSRRPAREILDEAGRQVRSLKNPRGSVGLSPHALYSTTPELVKLTSTLCRQKGWRWTSHLAESEQEFEMYSTRRGSLFDWLKNQRDMSDCGDRTPVQQFDRLGALSSSLLAVHVNYVTDEDARLLGERQVSVVHCPRSHGYFRYRPFPAQTLANAGVNLCLGTDSLASVSRPRIQPLELDMFAEMQLFASNHPELLPASVLQMATINGASSLGLAGKVGEIIQGAFADLIAVPFQGSLREVFEAVIRHRGAVSASMIDGSWAVAPGHLEKKA